MAALVKQYSRISHHTLAGATGSTFSVPSQEDFTDSTSPWTIYDLALSEFGVNEADKKLYIRIADEIKEVGFASTASTAETLEQTLALGNTMGTYSIVTNTGKIVSTSNISALAISDTSFTIQSPQIVFTKDNNTNNCDEYYQIIEGTSSGTASYDLFSIGAIGLYGNDGVMTIESTIQAYDIALLETYCSQLFGFFHASGGTLSQVGSIDINERGSATQSTSIITTDGSDIILRVSGNSAGSNTNWVAKVKWSFTY